MIGRVISALYNIVGMSLVTMPFTALAAAMDMLMLNWFIVPYLGLKPVSFLMAFGLRYTLMLYRQRQSVEQRNPSNETFVRTAFGSALIDLMALIAGFIIHLSLSKGM